MNRKGITLIALVITIIVLLILAGISISILSGDNSILKRAGDAKSQTDIAQEKEIVKLAVTQAMINNKSTKYNKIDLEKELSDQNVAVEESGLNFKIKFNDSNRFYRLNQKGEIKYFEEISPTDIYAKLDTDGTLYLRSSPKSDYEIGKKWNSSNILKIKIEEPIAPKTASEMFQNCTNLTSIENIENLHTENVTSMYYMFYNCNNLESLDLSNFDTSKVTTMRAMFCQCHKIKTLDLSNFNTQNLNNMINMFYGCNNLITIDLSGFNTKKVTSMTWLFRACSSLTSVKFGNIDTSNVTSMEYMFGTCKNLTSLDVSNFDTCKVTSMNMMFNGCSSLIDLDVSHFDMSNVSEMNAMFRSCKNLSYSSLNNILYMCKEASQISEKTLAYIEVAKNLALTCNTLSNYNSFVDAGWSIGY